MNQMKNKFYTSNYTLDVNIYNLIPHMERWISKIFGGQEQRHANTNLCMRIKLKSDPEATAWCMPNISNNVDIN